MCVGDRNNSGFFFASKNHMLGIVWNAFWNTSQRPGTCFEFPKPRTTCAFMSCWCQESDHWSIICTLRAQNTKIVLMKSNHILPNPPKHSKKSYWFCGMCAWFRKQCYIPRHSRRCGKMSRRSKKDAWRLRGSITENLDPVESVLIWAHPNTW